MVGKRGHGDDVELFVFLTVEEVSDAYLIDVLTIRLNIGTPHC